jgi:hypothetical protein
VNYVDDRGRVFGRINLVDAAMAAIFLLLIPLGYGTYLLFRPTMPRIDSVAPSTISKEEQRISAGGRLTAKFKVKGEAFTPLLRARVGDADALGFVFENPNSADVLVGPMPAGAHDLVLLDGIQEVARASGAITIQPSNAMAIRAVGWLTNLEAGFASELRAGTAFPAEAPAYRVIALGPVIDGYRRVALAGSAIELPSPNTRARKAVLALECDPTQGDNPCTMGERIEHQSAPVTISLPGPAGSFNFAIEELLPSTPPVKAILRVRQSMASSGRVRPGDRDDLVDERAAIVSGVAGDVMTLEAGVDRDRRGWRYRGQRLLPGARFVFATDSYQTDGILQSVEIALPKP